MKRLLVIDDESALRMLVRAVMESAGWQVAEAASGLEAIGLLSENPHLADVALLDMRMPGLDGHATLARLHEIRPSLPVVMLTAFGTVGSAVDAMKRGAFDYITKPADNDELLTVLEKAYQYSTLLNENARLRQELEGDSAGRLLGNSPSMRQIVDFIHQVAPSEATVLIMGESGTGKELVADALHGASGRADKPLVKVNCAALPGQLLESELFGYEKGAFTGAVKDKPGRFMLARGGSIFLDEIGELPLDIQAKLLRVLQERVVEPLGSVKPVPVDVRIICATNRNLRQEVQEGRFREDLYFRLNVLEVNIPPLRDRLDDLPMLVNGLLERLSNKNKKPVRRVMPSFLDALAAYGWPGNVRELENVLERALILSRSDILGPESLPSQILQGGAPGYGLSGHEGGLGMTGQPYPGGERQASEHSSGSLYGQPASQPLAANGASGASFPQPGQTGQGGASYASGAHSAYPGQPGMGGSSVPSGQFGHSGQFGAQPYQPAGPQAGYAGGGMGGTGHPGQSGGFAAGAWPGQTGGNPLMPELANPLEKAEYEALLSALRANGGHRERTAEALGVSRRTLQYKLKKFGLTRQYNFG